MTQEFLNEEKIPFKDCTREDQHILLDALIDGKVEYLDQISNKFTHVASFKSMDFLNLFSVLRTKPVKRLAIPWEHIKPEYRWAAMDRDGEVYIYDAQPTICKIEFFWGDNGSNYRAVDFLSSIDIEGIDWRDSLVERPADK